MMRLVCCLSLVIACLSCATGPLGGSGRPAAYSGVRPLNKTILDNGLAVLVHESHSHPLVTVDVWVRTGSADETPALNGASHFLEHMMFKGTDRYGPGEIDRVIEGLGGVWNAGTSKEFTHYYLTVGSEFFREALEVMGNVLTRSTFAPEEFERERGVILEEWRRKQDNPQGLLYEEIYRQSFATGPYRATVLGSFESISELSRKQLVDYYKRRYTPGNIAVVISGDVSNDDAVAAVGELFGAIAGPAKPTAGLEQPLAREMRHHEVIQKDVKEAYLALSWPAPGIAAEQDVYALDLLSMILGDGRTSRLYRNVREKKQLATSIGAHFPTSRHPTLLLVTAVTAPDKTADLRAAIEQEIARLRDKSVTRAELARAKKMAVNGYYFATESTTGVSQTLGYYYTLTGSEQFEQEYLERLAQVRPADIKRVARRYFSPTSCVSVEVRPAEDK
ncbi:M16 family metallopeptidase [Candidatus Sumerlaeota bacterium]